MILSLDIGSKLGTVLYHNKIIDARTYKLGVNDSRYYDFKILLEEIHLIFKLDQIAFENAAFQIGNAIPVYHGLIGVLKSFCLENKIDLIPYPVSVVKKVFTGSGNASKKVIMKKCDELGIKYDTADTADAIAVLHTHLKQKGGENERGLQHV